MASSSGYALEKRYGRWWAKVELEGGERPRVPLGVVGEMTEERAREKVRALIEAGRRDGNLAELVGRIRERAGLKGAEHPAPAAPALVGETVGSLGKAWWTGKLFELHGESNQLKLKKSAKSDEWRFNRVKDVEVRPGVAFGALPVVDVREEDVDRVFRTLPRGWRPETRMKIYAMLHRLFELAIVPCRLRRDNPVGKHLRPARGDGILLQHLYPDEVLSALRNEPEKTPLGRRVWLALATYTGLRKKSLRSLLWRDVDLARGVVRSLVQKNGMPQVFALELPGLLHVVRAWYEHRGRPDGSTPVLRDEDLGVRWERLARALQADLKAAGVMRPELFETTAKSRAMRAHDARATFVTWAKRAGKDDGWVTSRTGHLDLKMVARYTRAATTLADLNIDPFPDLTSAIPELAPPAPVPPPPGQEPVPDESPAPRNEDLRTPRDPDVSDHASSILGEHVGGPNLGAFAVDCGSSCRGFDSRYSPQTYESDHTSRGHDGDKAAEVVTRSVTSSQPPAPVGDPVEIALAEALRGAASKDRWDVVAQLARELEARRTARDARDAVSNVVPLGRARR